MARISKEYQVRKNEIMDTAQSLFYTQGYDSVTVNLIIKTIGISKGTFYHYFSSKEELLDQLIHRFTITALDNLQPIIDDDSLNAIDKINLLYKSSSRFKLAQADLLITIINVFYDDRNIMMRYKMRKKNNQLFAPIFAKIFQQGIDEKVFTLDNPEKTAELVMILGQTLSDKTAILIRDSKEDPSNKKEFIAYLQVYQDCIEKILGAPEKSIKVFDEGVILKFFDWYK
jgi:AcrR family transcriptional regulator